MANMKLTLGRLADFQLPVEFSMPNGETASITFKVRHMKASEVQEMYSSESVTSDSDLIMNIATGWNLEDEFNAENAKELIDLFPGVAVALAGAYLGALAGQRVKR